MSKLAIVLKYRGYSGSVIFSTDGEVFHGKILFIDDLITFEGATYKKIVANFHAAVDDYITTCSTLKKSSKPFSGSFNIRIPPELHKQLFIEAKERGISMNKYIQEKLNK
jgi:predicted HicB family RNase H-like nuclease